MYNDNVILAGLVDALIMDVEKQKATINTLTHEVAWLKQLVDELKGDNK